VSRAFFPFHVWKPEPPSLSPLLLASGPDRTPSHRYIHSQLYTFVLWLQASLPSIPLFLFSPPVSFSSLFLSASTPSSPVSTSNEGCRAQVYPWVECSHLTQAHARPLSAKFLVDISKPSPSEGFVDGNVRILRVSRE